MNKTHALADLAAEVVDCHICRQNSIGVPVFGEGNPDAKVMFVGEAPGKQEAKVGRPFIGPSGKLLRHMIAEVGLREEEVYITSPVKYLPMYKTPKPADIAHAKIHFDKQVSIINPKIIVLLGSVAAQAILGEKVAVLTVHGTTREAEGKIYFLTLHPAAVLRVPTLKPLFLSDFETLKHLLAK